MNQDFPEDELLIEIRGSLAVVTLNRPASLNALSLDMIRQMASALHQWKDMAKIKAVLFVGAGDRAFCAGGDIKSFYYAGMDYRRGQVSAKVPAVFFAEEYSLNKQIFHYPKPIISFMNGITMGGGYGIAGNSKYRVATEKTVFAMPEVGIGFYPDVGSMYHLSRAKDHFGRYLALTGNSISGADMVHCGLSEYYIQTKSYKDLIGALEKSDDVEGALKSFHEAPPKDGVFTKTGGEIKSLFNSPDVSGLLANLEKAATPLAKDISATITARSPSSVMVSAAYLEKAQGLDFDAVMETDFRVTQNFIKTADLYEGIRAQLIDKDRNPRWAPDNLKALEAAEINAYFTPTGYDLKDVQIFES